MSLGAPNPIDAKHPPRTYSVGTLTVTYKSSEKHVLVQGVSGGDREFVGAKLFIADKGTVDTAVVIDSTGECFILPSCTEFQVPKGEELVDASVHSPSGDLIIRTRDQDHNASFYSARRRMCIYRRNGWAYYHENHPDGQEPAFSTVLPQRKVGPDIAKWMQAPAEWSSSVARVQKGFSLRLGGIFGNSKRKVA